MERSGEISCLHLKWMAQMFHCLCNRLVVNIYWDECIKAWPIWWVPPSLDGRRKLQLNRASFHSTCIFIKERSEVTSKVLIRAFSGRKEKKKRFSLVLHKHSSSFWSDLQLELRCLIRKARIVLSSEQGSSVKERFSLTIERSLIFLKVEVIDQLDDRDKPLVRPQVSFT